MMKKLLFILLVGIPLITKTEIPAGVKDFVGDQAKKAGKDAVKFLKKKGLAELADTMTSSEALLTACTEGMVITTTQVFPPEYFFAILGEKMGIRLNPAHYSVQVRRAFYRCLCSNPDETYKALSTVSPLPLLKCAPALGYGFIAAVKEFIGDLKYYRDSLSNRYTRAKAAVSSYLYGQQPKQLMQEPGEFIVVDDYEI